MIPPPMTRLTERAAVRLPAAVHKRAKDDGVGTLSAALTCQAFLSLLPLTLLGLSVVGFLLAGHPGAREEWADRLAGAIPGLQPLIGRNLGAVVDGRFATGLIGLVGVVWGASGLAAMATHALGRVFRTETGSAVRIRLRALATMVALGVLGLASVAITSVAAGWSAGGVAGTALRVAGIALGLAVDAGFFLVAYQVLTPGRGPLVRGHLPGALLMAAGWTMLKVAGSWYSTGVVANATALYGAVGAVFGLLAILNLSARLFLYGAELSAVLAGEGAGGRPSGAVRA